MATLDEIKLLKRKYSADLLRKPGVVGVDIHIQKAGAAELLIHLDTKDPDIWKELPDQLDGFPVKFTYTGAIRKFEP